MEVKEIKSFFSKKLFFLFFLLVIFIYLKYLFEEDHRIKKKFIELNNIDLYILPVNNINLESTITQYNFFDSPLISYSIDNSKELLFRNSLKTCDKAKLNIYSRLFSDASFNGFLNQISALSYPDSINNYTIDLLSNITPVLISYLSDKKINKDIVKNLFYSMLIDDIDYMKYNRYKKINLMFNSPLNGKSDFENRLSVLFETLQSMDKQGLKIQYIKFYNSYSYNLFEDFKKINSLNINSILQDRIIYYDNKIKPDNLPFNTDDVLINNINNYLTNESLNGEKYKIIKKINYNYNNFVEVDDKSIMEILDQIEININNFKMNANIKSDLKIENILNNLVQLKKYFSNYLNDYKIQYLKSNYNEKSREIINLVANTEPVNINFLDSYIYNYYRNSVDSKYVVFIDILKPSTADTVYDYIYEKYGSDSSVYLDRKIIYLNLSLYIIAALFLMLCLINRGKSNEA